jgi:hypothetical protein
MKEPSVKQGRRSHIPVTQRREMSYALTYELFCLIAFAFSLIIKIILTEERLEGTKHVSFI